MSDKSKNPGPEKNIEYEKLKTQVLVKMQLLIGCCRTKSITKAMIEKSIQEFIKELDKK